MAKPTRAQLKAENKQLRAANLVNAVVSVLRTLIKTGGFVACFYYVNNSIGALAGRETMANIGVSFITDMKVNEWLCYAIGAGGTVYGSSQKKLRRDAITRMGTRLAEAEREIDPGRSSSRLMPSGATRPGDG